MLELKRLSKQFAHVHAVREASCTVRDGRVTALLGDNGAGKSTLVKMICGTHKPTAGDIRVNGRPVQFESPRDALAHGITAVYQDLALVDQRDAIHNISLGAIPLKWGGILVDRARMRAAAERALAAMKVRLPSLSTPVGSMSGGQRQAVAIARALNQGGRLVIMDEPTAALGIREQRMVLDLIQDLRHQGTSVLIISHNLDHVFEVADDLIVMRGGRVVAEVERRSVAHEDVVKLILSGAPRPVASVDASAS